jgi:general secretion pathway protein H
VRSRGFTLIELLVVLLIIGTVVSLATMALSDNRGEQMEQEARRLAAVLQLAADEAVLSSAPIGVRFYDNGYAFLRRQQEQWQPIEGDRQLRSRELPDPLRLQFMVNGDAGNDAFAGEDEAQRPHAVLVSSGELEPGFELSVNHPELARYYRIVARPDGRFEFHAED